MDELIKKRPLSVCILTNIPAPYRLPVFEHLGQYMELTVFYCQSASPERKWVTDLASKNVKNITLASQKLPFISKIFIYNPDLKVALQNEPFDIYIAGENFDTAVSVITLQKAAKKQNKPFILWSEAIDTAYASGNIVSNLYRHRLYARTDRFLAYSEMSREYLIKRKVSPDKISRGYQIVPSAQLPAPTKTKADLGFGKETIILYLGHFEPRKGLDLLIAAFKQVKEANCRLVLVGDGQQKALLQAIALDDERIQFKPYAEGSSKSNWLFNADIFVLPSHHDPWGLAVNEAMMAGLPIITTSATAVSEIIQNNGLVIPPANQNALQYALQKLINDPGLRSNFGKESQKIIADYTVQKAANAFYDVIVKTQQKQDTAVS